ncbi:Uncharacterized protein APZ42_017214 [Daphnia magna]|uniref:Uncharacterized protein n=1 Tax=Daphnia magna TaxID=35525 RepID=A0A164ZQ67_9CRUS|nr:Uncharacterized protein APZ42_017214 [Daphnia magna]
MKSDSLFYFGNVFLGIFAFSLQTAALAVSDAIYIPDLVCTGIWGGAFLVLFASLLKKRMLNSGSIKALAVYSILIGFTLIGLHAWSISSYSNFIDFCELFIFSNEIGLCEWPSRHRLVVDLQRWSYRHPQRVYSLKSFFYG